MHVESRIQVLKKSAEISMSELVVKNELGASVILARNRLFARKAGDMEKTYGQNEKRKTKPLSAPDSASERHHD